MHCHHCGFEVTADFQFCPKGGNTLRRDCPQCGYICSPEFRYCPKCGTGIAPATTVALSPVGTNRPATQAAPPSFASLPGVPEAEQRLVTMLFADVVGFTSLAEQLDPEDLRSLMMSCFQTLAEEIRHYGGFSETMAKPPPQGGERGVFYPIFRLPN